MIDVFERRLRLMVHTFTHPVYPELLVVCAALLIAGDSSAATGSTPGFGPPMGARAGYLGALARGAGRHARQRLRFGAPGDRTIYLAICAVFYWATQAENRIPERL